MPLVGFELAIPVFEWSRNLGISNCAATRTGPLSWKI